MAIRAAKKTNIEPEAEKEKAQLELVVRTPEDKRQELANLIAKAKLKKIQRKRILGEAKMVLNEIKELIEKAEDLSSECASGQLVLELQSLMSEEEEESDLEGRVMDVSNVKKPSDFMKGLEDSLTEAEDDEDETEE